MVWLLSSIIARNGRALVGIGLRGKSKTLGAPLRTVHGRTQDKVELRRQARRAEEGSVGPAPSFQQNALHAEFRDLSMSSRKGEIELRLSGEDVGTRPHCAGPPNERLRPPWRARPRSDRRRCQNGPKPILPWASKHHTVRLRGRVVRKPGFAGETLPRPMPGRVCPWRNS